nr:phage tail spike protein [Priestia megaterium]
MSKIIIADGQNDQVVDWISSDNIIDNKHIKSLENTLETFEFRTFGDKPFSEYLTKRNRIIIPDEDGEWVEFIIFEGAKFRDGVGTLLSEVYTQASYVSLKKAKVISPIKTEAISAENHVSNALAGTEWQIGTIAFKGVRSLTLDNYTNPYAYIRKVASEFDLELHFRVDVGNYRVTKRYVDLIEKQEVWRGRTIEFGHDLLAIRRVEKTNDIVTALKGVGPEREDGTRLEVFVEDREALDRWGRNGLHLVDVYEPQSTDQNMTLDRLTTLTENELEKRVNAVIEYEANIADLEYVPGMENKKIRFGDKIKIKDLMFHPPLYLEARVHTVERSITDKSQKKVTLGDYIEYTEEEVKAIWKQLQDEIRKKVSEAQLQEFTYTKSEIDNKDGLSRVHADDVASLAESNAKGYADEQKENLKSEIEDGQLSLPTSSLEGAIQLATNLLQNATSTIYTDNSGNFYFVDGDYVVKITSKGIAVSSNGVTGPFDNALTGQGLNASAIFTGILNADKVTIANGVVTINNKGVNVKNGSFTLEDPTTGVKSILRENSNMIADHSFELLVPGGQTDSISTTAGLYSVNQTSLTNSPWSNTNPSDARLMVSFDASTETLFGQRAAVLRGLDFGSWDQIVQIPAQYKYTKSLSFSAFVAPFEKTTYNVTVSMRMQLLTKSGAWVQDLNTATHVINHNEKYNWTRLSVSYTGDIPNGDYDVRIRIFLTNNTTSAMLLCDGVQLVPYEHPTSYFPETQVYRVLTGIDEAQNIVTDTFSVTRYASIDTLWVREVEKKAHSFLNLFNGWVDYGGNYQRARYTKTADGMVYLSGLIRDGLVGNYTAAILPTGCRPNQTEVFATGNASASSPARVYVYANGDIKVQSGNNTYVSLSGICFLGER